MKTIAVVPARYDSSRFPGKLLADLNGMPVILRTLGQAAKARRLEGLLVATDDPRIAEVVEAAGYPACLTRKDHPSGTDRIAEAVAEREVDLVVNVQGDEPFIAPELIDRLVARMTEADAPDIGTACTPILQEEELHASSVVKVVRDVHGCALYFSRSLIPFSRDSDPARLLGQGLYQRHLGIYAYRKTFLTGWRDLPPHPLEETEKLEQLRALAHGAKIAVIETTQMAPGIDTPADLAAAEDFIRQHPEYNL